MSGSKHKSKNDIGGIAEELKRFVIQRMAKGFSLFEEALLVSRHKM